MMRMNSQGQWMPAVSLILAAVVIVGLLVVIANQPAIGGGAGAISQWCTNNVGQVIPAATGLCASIPFEAVGYTISNPPQAPIGGGAAQPVPQVTTITFKMNPVEKYLAGTNTGTITCNRQVAGAWLADVNSNADTTMAYNQTMNLLCGKDTASGTDYYKRWLPNINTGYISPATPSFLFTREGTLSHVITNSNGITENAESTPALINASNTYYFNVKSDNTTSYSCYGNEESSKKVACIIDANYSSQISKITPFGIASTSGASIPPNHTLDANYTASRGFDIPTLNLCNGGTVSWKLKVEALSAMPANYDQTSFKISFYDYTLQKNTDTGAIVDSTYDPVSNADIGATDAATTGGTTEVIYYDDE